MAAGVRGWGGQHCLRGALQMEQCDTNLSSNLHPQQTSATKASEPGVKTGEGIKEQQRSGRMSLGILTDFNFKGASAELDLINQRIPLLQP